MNGREAFVLGPALLFCPADRPERYARAAASADAVILDLEDAVAPEAKPRARGALIEAGLDPAHTVVRVNPFGSADFAADMATLSQTDIRTVMVPKASSASDIAAIDPRFRVIALCESAQGVVAADEIARTHNVIAVMWGAEDLLASLGGASSRRRKGSYRDVARYARSRVLIAAAAAGKAAIDTVHLDIDDVRGLRKEARDAVAVGFAATACIHPSQVSVIREAYRPSESELRWAEGVLAAAEADPRGVFRFEGRMIDEPVLRQAHAIRARAGVRPV